MATQLIRGLSNLSQRWHGCVATIGNFDGVHRGHQALLATVTARAAALQVPAVAITFEPQPAEFFAGNHKVPARLTRLREKFHALAASKLDAVVVLRFDRDLAEWRAEEFMQRVLINGLQAQHVIVGDDFRFGKGREGDFAFLTQLGRTHHFTTENMPSVTVQGERVSSTRVRHALEANNRALVTDLLGRPYCMEGRVVYGDKRGRLMGFPTANIHLHRRVTPVRGVYAVRVHGVARTALPGVANVGTRPTLDGTRTLLEVHLFDFNQEIYKQHVTVEFCDKLRDEKRFDTMAALQAQISQDARDARAYFATREQDFNVKE